MLVQVFPKPYVDVFRVCLEYFHQRNLQLQQRQSKKKKKSHKNMLNNAGPKIDPFGAPYFISFQRLTVNYFYFLVSVN